MEGGAYLSVSIKDAAGRPLAAKVNLKGADGEFHAPEGAILKSKRALGSPYFYCEGSFSLPLPPGRTRLEVRRGLEYRVIRKDVELALGSESHLEPRLRRWIDMKAQGWYAGTTHLHWDEKETHPDERLKLVPQGEDQNVVNILVLKRWNLPYASNKYPIGVLKEFSSQDYIVSVGKEYRHNKADWENGYGHMVLLNFREVVQPISTGRIGDTYDYPPHADACDASHAQGGVVIWAHNGQGMEAPVDIALGKVDGMNLFDTNQGMEEGGYQLWYRFLNCGFRLPIATGGDWDVTNGNRVYVKPDGFFTYSSWIKGLKAGRTFITNNAMLILSVNGLGTGSSLYVRSSRKTPLEVVASARGRLPFERLELVVNGRVMASQTPGEKGTEAELSLELPLTRSSWIAARCYGAHQTDYGRPNFAHTSPVYAYLGGEAITSPEDAAYFAQALQEGIAWVSNEARVEKESQRERMLRLYHRAREIYLKMAGSARF